jgi:hypothetical protein
VVENLWSQWVLMRMKRQEIFFESRVLLKLSKLKKVRSNVSNSPKDGNVKFSMIDSLYSFLPNAAHILEMDRTKSAPPALEVSNDMLHQTMHEQYLHGGFSDRPVTPPLKMYGSSDILSPLQLKHLRHVICHNLLISFFSWLFMQ